MVEDGGHGELEPAGGVLEHGVVHPGLARQVLPVVDAGLGGPACHVHIGVEVAIPLLLVLSVELQIPLRKSVPDIV